MRKIPVKLAGMALFPDESKTELAVGDLTMPNFTLMSDTVSGAGVLGQINIPTAGHYDSMQLGVSLKSIDKEAFKLVSSQTKKLEFRGAFAEFDTVLGAMVTRAIKIIVKGFGTGIDLGTFAQNSALSSTINIEIAYIKIFIDGEEVLEFDRFAYISRINGVNDQEDVRKALGLS